MGYFVGKNLERRVAEFELGSLDELLGKVVREEIVWPGAIGIPADLDQLESLRVTVYSLLHKYGMKAHFTVKMIPDREIVTVDLKTSPKTKRRTGEMQLLSKNPYATGGKKKEDEEPAKYESPDELGVA